MKLPFIAFSLVLLLGCSQPTQQNSVSEKDSIMLAKALLPEAEKRRIFVEKVRGPEFGDKYMLFKDFYSQYYPYDTLPYANYNFLTEYYYSANEELINPQKIDNRKWFRLFVIPSFESVFCITLEKNEYSYNLTYKQFKEITAQKPNNIIFSFSHTTGDTVVYADFFEMLNKKNFLYRKPNFPKCSFHDPIMFVCEEINNGKYNKVEFALPWYSRCASDDDYYVIIEAMKLIKNSEIFPVLKKAFPPDKEEDWLNPYEFFESILNTPRQSLTE